MSPADHDESSKQPSEFSLFSGDSLFHLCRLTRLSGAGLHMTVRRMVATTMLVWLPLLLLSLSEGKFWGDSVALPFLEDVETHVRSLVAIPLLIAAADIVQSRLASIVRAFIDRGLIRDEARSQFDAAIASAVRLHNSGKVEILLILLVYAVGVMVVWRESVALDMSSWRLVPGETRLELSHAGWWAVCISRPLFQYLVLRWYFRMFVWARFLWQVSRIDLQLVATHPDGVAGLRFLSVLARAYAPVLLAQGTVLAGLIANRIFHAGAQLLSFEVEIVGTVAVMVGAVFGPLLVFSPQIRTARRRGMEQYGVLGQRYAREFDQKWIGGGAPSGEPLIGSADIQSLADLRSSYMAIVNMQSLPFGMKNIINLAVTTLLPVAPLLLTTFSVEEIVERLLGALL